MTYASLCNKTNEKARRLPLVPSRKTTTVIKRTVDFSLFFLILASNLPGQTGPGLSISPQSLPYGALGSFYNAQLTANNGSGFYQWSVTQGLPPGLSLDASKGVITGTPNTGGTYQFTITVLDLRSQQKASAGYTVGILNISNSSPLAGGTVSTPYSATFNASDGPPGYSYSWSIDTSPPGLSLAPSTGILSGSPSAAGTFNFNITVTASAPSGVSASPTLSTSKPFALTIQPQSTSGNLTISPQSLPFGALGSAYSAQLSANGSGSYQWSVSQEIGRAHV